MLPNHLAKKVLSYSLDQGADFVELFVEKNQYQFLKTLNQKIDKLDSGIDFGIGLRVVYGTKVLYGITNSTNEKDLLAIAKEIAFLQKNSTYKESNSTQKKSSVFILDHLPNEIKQTVSNHPTKSGLEHFKGDLRASSLEEKFHFLKEINLKTEKSHSEIIQASAQLLERFQEVQIFNSEGIAVSDERHYIRGTAMAVAKSASHGGVVEASESLGALHGFEFLKEQGTDLIASEVTRKVITILNAKPCPAEKMPVILGNGFGGVIFHEACGHLLETTSIEKNASVFANRLGEQIATTGLSAYDDGTIPHAWGSTNIDDEGTPTKRTELIREGKLVNFLADRIGNLKTGHPLTGSARRESYKYPPASRMRNTYICAGKNSIEEMIGSIDYGLWAKDFGGGSVQPATGDFNFVVLEGHMIRNGKVAEPVKGATLIGNGGDILNKISMIGNDLKLGVGMCGSVSGSVPVTVGQPSLKVSEIVVGGRG